MRLPCSIGVLAVPILCPVATAQLNWSPGLNGPDARVTALAAVNAAGNTLVTHAVLANTALRGSVVYLQGAAFDTGRLPGVMATSNGVSAQIGSR